MQQVKDTTRPDSGQFIVWNPASQSSPKVRHLSKRKAQEHARQEAEAHPGVVFYVCRLEGGATVETRQVSRVVVDKVQELKEF